MTEQAVTQLRREFETSHSTFTRYRKQVQVHFTRLEDRIAALESTLSSLVGDEVATPTPQEPEPKVDENFVPPTTKAVEDIPSEVYPPAQEDPFPAPPLPSTDEKLLTDCAVHIKAEPAMGIVAPDETPAPQTASDFKKGADHADGQSDFS